MKALGIGIMMAVVIIDALLLIACRVLETDEERERGDAEQMEWLKERKKE